VIATTKQIAGDIALGAAKAQQDAQETLKQPNITAEQRAEATRVSEEAQKTLKDWGTGGIYSRTLNAGVGVLTGALAGQGGGQITANAVAPTVAKMVGDIGTDLQIEARIEADRLTGLAQQAADRGDTVAAADYRAKASEAAATAANWGDNGVYRVGLHAATQGMLGGLASGQSGALESAAGVVGGNLGQQLGAQLGNVEAEKLGLTGEEKRAFVNAFQQTGAVVGGMVAGAAAGNAGSGNTDIGALLAAAQGGHAAGTVDDFNRRLHEDNKAKEKTLAAELAAKSKGKYTQKQVEDLLRAAGNSALGEDVTTGAVIKLTKDTPVSALYDLNAMTLQGPFAGQYYLVQPIASTVDPALAKFVIDNTGGTKSPYSWSDMQLGKGTPMTQTPYVNPFEPNASGCLTDDCAAGLLPNRHDIVKETRILAGFQGVGGATQAATGATLAKIGLATCFETGLGCVVGAIGLYQMAAGTDNVYTAYQSARDGTPHATTGGQLLRYTGLSPAASELVYGGTQIGSLFGASIMVGSAGAIGKGAAPGFNSRAPLPDTMFDESTIRSSAAFREFEESLHGPLLPSKSSSSTEQIREGLNGASGNQSIFDMRTAAADAIGQDVVKAMDGVISKERAAAVQIFTHQDGTVSVGISGDLSSPKTVEGIARLQARLDKEFGEGKFKVGTTTLDEKNGIVRVMDKDGKLSNAPGVCAEPKACTAAAENPSPITGSATISRSTKPNRYPYTAPNADSLSPNKMGPCLTCGNPSNHAVYNNAANSGKK